MHMCALKAQKHIQLKAQKTNLRINYNGFPGKVIIVGIYYLKIITNYVPKCASSMVIYMHLESMISAIVE